MKNKTAKRTIKYLAQCTDPRISKLVLTKCPDSVIKGIANAALNALRGEVHLSRGQKKKLAQQRPLIDTLVDKAIALKQKRKTLSQAGEGLQILPILLTAVLTSLGSSLFNK